MADIWNRYIKELKKLSYKSDCNDDIETKNDDIDDETKNELDI
jgi:hypothetical protein